ncbi:AraC family transcriptional regulator [Massilia sp. ST3]|uniref:AraC family transcriptional regulator n=1 Tax=Massilia sp. ST3 TaxID=2824903 RepID=UPI001B81C17F|nr:AraC family transcriptional regulator [Massilia sp. ST3]MBQ5946133.1 helix-turn-helix domain-containing protein [Massilia sp. ST3]
MAAPLPLDLHLRSYGLVREADRHDYAQIVLPVAGEVELDIEGRGRKLDLLHAAVVAPGAWHSQAGAAGNQSFILDLDPGLLRQGPWERLLDRPFTPIGAAARKLVEFMSLASAGAKAPPQLVQGWAPLLLDSLAQAAFQPASRLAALMARIELQPGLPWTLDTMARAASLSPSRLHALFRGETGMSPHEWLLRRRLEAVCTLLASTARPIADIALATGFSDQSVLTRAMRKAMDTTPAAYRRAAREDSHKTQ